MKIGVLATISLTLVLGLATGAWAGVGTDTDGDGVLDVNDNCIEVVNPAQCDDGNTAGVGNTCDMDYSGDATVSGADVSGFAADFGSAGPGDGNCDGTVSGADVSFFADRFGSPPGPSCCD